MSTMANKQLFLFEWLLLIGTTAALASIPTTLDGPTPPVTVPLDSTFRGNAEDLPSSDERLQRKVKDWEPDQISVSLSSSFHSVWISWATGDYQIGDDIKPLDPTSVESIVEYSTHSNLKSKTKHAKGHSLVYNQLYPFEGLQNYTSPIIHHVLLTGLKPDTVYYYRCGDPNIQAMSEIHNFRTMPISSSNTYPSRIAIAGDLGLTYNTSSTIDHLMRNNPDLVIILGDMCYANLYLTNGTGADCYRCSFPQSPIHETYQPRWDYWGRFIQPLASKVPMMVIEGNHEIEEQVGGRTFEAYKSRFAFPSKESESHSEFYYSFNAGGIHFLMLGAYISYNRSSEQYKWLEKDLAKVDRKVTPWLVATWHSPWYSTYTAHYKELECMRVEMEELLYKNGVDIVFNGHVNAEIHVHAYERSNRVYNYALDPCGPVHITIGDGGNREKMAITHADEPGNCPKPPSKPDPYTGSVCASNFTSGAAAGKFCWDSQPIYSAVRDSSFGHGILEMKNETHALWTWHRNQDMYEKAGDQIYIVREPDRCPISPKAPEDSTKLSNG